jgi:hypothetical protein
MLMGVGVTTASATYLGYGGGNPAPVDIWAATHPEFGRVMEHHATAGDGGCQGYLHKAQQTGSSSWWHRYHECEKG